MEKIYSEMAMTERLQYYTPVITSLLEAYLVDL
jgi:hypothetical protein